MDKSDYSKANSVFCQQGRSVVGVGLRGGATPKKVMKRTSLASLIPGWRTATSDSAISCHSFLVVRRGTPVSSRRIETKQGVTYAVDQLMNPESVILRPGGLLGDVLLYAELATAHDSAVYRELTKSIGLR